MRVFTFVSLLALALGSNVASAADSGTHMVNLTVDAPEPEISLTLFGNTTGSITSSDFFFADDAQTITISNPLLKRIQRSLGLLEFSATGEFPARKRACRVSIQSAQNWTLVNSSATQTGAGQPGRPIPYTLHAISPVAPAINAGGINPAFIESDISNNHCEYAENLIFNMVINYIPETGTYKDTLNFTTSAI